ncbi:MAG TPA: outer membrane protein assembly factor BamD [Candidatus Acidoferrales bacterium]|nr:outer membrane protein assembly factor BamD [Candidatus Acidoferrales bacterium]
MKNRRLVMAALALSLTGTLSAGAYAQKKPKITKVKPQSAQKKKGDTAESAEPDKVLYERAMVSIKHSKFTEARLDLQTLVNTYPDSEYLAKAKLAVADSFYKEGGTSGLTQAVEEYKNFIVFFPFLDEAAYAQMQVGMAHYRMMEKPDRDNSHAQAAEDEFRTFLLKYPQSPLLPQAEQNLRNVQEMLADGEYRIARFYYLKKDYRASAARLVEVSGRYPLYSQSDDALWMLGEIYTRAKQVSKNEDDKNHWADLAAKCYDRILRDYPLSELAGGAKSRLTSMGMPIPAADPGALARMRQQQEYVKHHHENVLMKFPMGMIKSSPDVYAAARTGQPNLNPPDDLVSATEVLNQGAAGPSFTVAAAGIATGGDAAPVDTETVGGTSDAPATSTGVQTIEPSADATPGTTADASSTPPSTAPAADATTEVSTASTPSSSDAVPSNAVAASQTPPTSPSADSQAGSQPSAPKSDPKTESTSKKKKGLRKVVPW